MIPFADADYITLSVYLLAIAIFGSSFYQRKSTAREYFLGGRSMGWLPIGISIVAADLSAISVMGSPAWAYKNNLTLLWVTVGYPLVAPIVILIFVPFYSKLNLYTAYEYLERRFNPSVRSMGSGLFQILRAWHVAVAIYGPALVIHLVSGLPVWKCVLAMGLFTTFYTTLGGMKAVIWTDVIQFTTVITGVVVILWVAVRGVPGGIPAIYSIAHAAGRLQLVNLSTNPNEMTTLWACLIGGAFLALGPLTTDQAILQRLFAAKSTKDFRQSILLQAFLIVPVIALLNCIGVALFAYYHAHPERLQHLHNLDAIVPYFVLTELPYGLAGLVIAAIFAASMAVMSAGINALTTATTVDYYARFLRAGRSGEHYASIGRIGTAAWGCVVTLMALFAGRAGDLAIAYSRISSMVVGPMLGIFLLGVTTRRANSNGVQIGAITGAAVILFVSVRTSWSFFYFGAIGTIVTFVLGYLFSLLFPPPGPSNVTGLVMGEESPDKLRA
ncbi:MAG: sodium:solute symporter family transporter [Acidobacteriaceae bacterium]